MFALSIKSEVSGMSHLQYDKRSMQKYAAPGGLHLQCKEKVVQCKVYSIREPHLQ